jgi:hypothetical protein
MASESSEHVRVVAAVTPVLDLLGSKLDNEDFFSDQRRLFERAGGIDKGKFLELMAEECGMFTPAGANPWSLLEAIVVCDHIAFDRYAFLRKQGGKKLFDRAVDLGLVASTWNEGTYERAAEAVLKWKELHGDDPAVQRAATEVAYDDTQPYSAGNDWMWDNGLKDQHDGLYASPKLKQYSFADSDDSIDRVIFYVTLSTDLGWPMLPTRAAKGTVIDALAKAHEQWAQLLVHDVVKPFDAKVRPGSLNIAFPPLAQKIVMEAVQSGRSPVSVAREMHETDSAKAYRAYLARVEAARQAGDLEELKRLLDELNNVVEQWTKDGAPLEGVFKRTRRMKVKSIPTVAALGAYIIARATGHGGEAFKEPADLVALAAAVGLVTDKIEFGDPILWGAPRHIAFVADWYSSET